MFYISRFFIGSEKWGFVAPAGSKGMAEYDTWADNQFEGYCRSIREQRDYGAMPIYTASKPEDRRPANPIGSMQTSLPIFDDNNNPVTARSQRYPTVPVDSILPKDYHWTDSLVNPSSLQYDPIAEIINFL